MLLGDGGPGQQVALASETRIVDLHGVRLNDAHICGHPFPKPDLDQIPYHKLPGLNRRLNALPNNDRLGWNEILKRGDQTLRFFHLVQQCNI